MAEAESKAVAPPPEVLSAIISRLKQAGSPRLIVLALRDNSVSHFVQSDACGLILPDNSKTEQKRRVCRAWWMLDDRAETSTNSFDANSSPFKLTLEEGAPSVLGAEELLDLGTEGGDARAQSALVMPLATDGEPFGALCFLSHAPEAYTADDAQKGHAGWLAGAVALAVEAALSRERLEHAEETVREIEQIRSGFAGTLVRDIRLPLTNVLGLLELFESKLLAREPFDMEDRQLLSGVAEQGRQLRRLVDDFLEIARQQEQPLALDLEPCETEKFLEEVLDPLRGAAALRGIELKMRVAPRTPDLHIDFRQAQRALRRLLTTALAATGDGGRVQLEAQGITGTRTGDAGRRFVVINVSDTSDGIPPEELPYVFDAFRQSADARRSAAQGIGLAIAKRVVAAHGGNVSVRSRVGAGTTYTLLLPAHTEPTGADARRVLVVDDAPELLLLLGKLIERMGYQVATAPSAARALEILNEQAVDLLITDWAMPETNGGELIASVKRDARWHKLPTVVLTGHDTGAERREAEHAGCDRFLVKPIMRDELQSVISELIPVHKSSVMENL